MKRFATILILLIAIGTTREAAAANRQRIRTFNIAVQPIVTLASAALQGKLTGRDVLRCLRVGAVAGYAFYESKRLAGDGHWLSPTSPPR